MALREELNRLDSEVASGQITAEEFRTRRDHLLAAAGSGPATARFPATADERTRAVPRSAPTAEERTQVVARAQVPASERTQVVPRQAVPAEERTQVVRRPPAVESDRTQVVRAGRPSPGYATLGAPPWARVPNVEPPGFQRPEGTLPPWTLSPTSGPRADQVSPTPTSGSQRWLILVLVGIVLLTVIGVCLYLVL